MVRKSLITPFLVALLLMANACKQTPNTECVDSDSLGAIDSTDLLLPDTMLWGHVGEGTTMNVIEFITETGDTLYLSKTSQLTGDYAEMLGDIRNQTDLFAITTRLNGANDEATLRTCVNTTEMLGVWKNGDERFAMYADGSADNGKETLKAWQLTGTNLVLTLVSKTEYGETMVTDTLKLIELSETTLRFSNRHGEETTFVKRK